MSLSLEQMLQVIGAVGFPIFACIMMGIYVFWFSRNVNETLKKVTAEMNKLGTAVLAAVNKISYAPPIPTQPGTYEKLVDNHGSN